eukprot:scaffold212883_cov17-Prasinocladus_malaysianus.AAC.1
MLHARAGDATKHSEYMRTWMVYALSGASRQIDRGNLVINSPNMCIYCPISWRATCALCKYGKLRKKAVVYVG